MVHEMIAYKLIYIAMEFGGFLRNDVVRDLNKDTILISDASVGSE